MFYDLGFPFSLHFFTPENLVINDEQGLYPIGMFYLTALPTSNKDRDFNQLLSGCLLFVVL